MSNTTNGDEEGTTIWTKNYINDDHIEAFAKALATDAHDPGDQSPLSPRSPPIPIEGTQTWNHGPQGDGGMLGGELGRFGKSRIEKLSAVSDFAPIHQKVRRRRATSQGWTYQLMRFPILAFLLGIINIEFGFYVLVRQIVNVFEYLLAWRGHKRTLRRNMRVAKTYEEWVEAAKKLDTYLGFDEWKEAEEDSYFDYHSVRKNRRSMARARAANDTRAMMDTLSTCIRPNFVGTEGVRMYSETFYGTKYAVENHIENLVSSLDFIRTATNVSLEEKRHFFRSINKNYGSSALCLSGGASFGYYHFGVIKAFLDADLLPRVITGTSAGGLVAALLCTRTDAELREILVPKLADMITACEDPFNVWIKRFWQTGARFSTIQWAKKAMFFTHGSLTFKEAYERTGRALNITVVPADRHSPTILLNHLTAPTCLIWSAIIASAAVPGILNPVVLMAKDRNGQVQPHNLGGSRFKDGSLREDIPLGSLHTQFNCNFSIVSQTNPHIHLFFFAPRGSVGRPVAHRKGKGWRGGFILSALESYIKLDLSKHFKVIRDLDLMPQILQSDWSGVFLQRFSGDLTLTPRSTISDWTRILSDPNPTQLERMLQVGQKVTWPALHMVRNRMTIERAITRGRAEVRAAMQRERTTNDQTPRVEVETNQIPIESDADVGFARRTRKPRTGYFDNHNHNHNYGVRGSAPELVYGQSSRGLGLSNNNGNGFGNGNARRRKAVPKTRRHGSEVSAVSDSEDPRDVARPMESPNNRNYASTFGETFRHVRASSLSAFGTNFSPFRSRTQVDGLPNPAPTPTVNDSQSLHPSQHTPNRRQGSRMSLSRWLGVGMDESDSEDDMGDMALRIHSPGLSEEPASFHLEGVTSGGGAIDDSDSEGEGQIAIPGGERVTEAEISGGLDIRFGGESGQGQDGLGLGGHSPPGQDRGES